MVVRNSVWHELAEAWKIFSMEGPVWRTLRGALEAMSDAGIPCAVVGGLAVFLHGHRRMTNDVDVLISPRDRESVRKALPAAGFRLRKGEFLGESGVPLHLHIAGDSQGIDWASNILFPDPAAAQVSSVIDGIPTVRLARLLELKLSYGLSNPRRPRDADDALRLMEVHRLDKTFAGKLHPLLRAQYKKLVDVMRNYPP